jgi:hypothetical protein
MTHTEREKHKDAARTLMAKATTTKQRVQATMMFIEAYFARNPKCPNIETYAAHYLWASRSEVPRDALKILIRRFPTPEEPKIQTGFSDWNPKGAFV